MDVPDAADHTFVKPVPPARVIRTNSLRRGREDVAIDDRVKLERVLGLTVSGNAALDCDPTSELVAYPAGCTIVLFNTKKNQQQHIVNTSRKTVTCVAFSPDGKFLASGECGHAPSLRVWNMADLTLVAEFQGHKYGINCVAFSPNGRNLVSVGSQHDMIVNVWDWRSNVKVASNKVSTRVKAVSFAENGKYFVTVGVRHVKFWYLDTKSHKNMQPVPLIGRPAILGEQRDNYFCDVACGKGANAESTYAITKSGLLCEFNVRRLLAQWVELRTRSANCMTVGDDLILVGCADGIVRCFSQNNLQFLVTLPRTHYLGVDVSQGLDIRHLMAHPEDAKYPDAIAVAYDQVSKKVTCVYNDHSLYVWDVNNIHRVGKSHSFLYHSACIWGVEMFPDLNSSSHNNSAMPPIPPGTFITCSSDDTIRMWNLNHSTPNNENIAPDNIKRNIYSKDLLKVVYIDSELTHLKDVELTNSTGEKADVSGYDGKNGVRCVRISPDGKHLASGDRQGNIRIHELQTLRQAVMIEAHDAEVLNLEYTTDCPERLLASASRDRLIHVFDVDKGYNCIQTLDDHSSSITAVRYLNLHGQLQMVSCSADKSIIFRPYVPTTSSGMKQFLRQHIVAGKTTLYDMEVDSTQKHVMTACQDRNIRVYNVTSGKHSKTFKGSLGEDGTLIKVSLDRSGIYIATSCTDKSLSVYDYYSGECMATMLGHSELVTGLRFTNDCKRLISASGDGCIFVWKLPRDMVVTMQARLQQQAVRKGRDALSLRSIRSTDDDRSDSEKISDVDQMHTESDDPSPSIDGNANIDRNGFSFGVGLPAWARRRVEDPVAVPSVNVTTASPEHPVNTGYRVVKISKPPQGRWAQRIENNEIKIATFSPEKLPTVESPSSLDSHEEGKQKEEGAEFDGDAEDSDVDMETHYYPTSVSESKSDFFVNANDLEELRRSSRKFVRPTSLPGGPLSSASGGDSDLEDGSSEADTPIADITMSKLSASTDGLHLLAQRATYLNEQMDFASDQRKDSTPGKSLTGQYLVRNTAVINAAKQTISDIEKTNKRGELLKRLEDTRRTLQKSGLSSPLRSSQSICDLSRYQTTESPGKRLVPPTQSEPELDDDEGLRRAISLSDLSNSSGDLQVKPHGHTSVYNNGANSRTSTTSSMQRCRSVGVLNRTDSETDLRESKGGGLMRPTISSQNKVAGQGTASVGKTMPPPARPLSAGLKKRFGTQSSVNLTTTGVNDDSSSEEISMTKGRTVAADKNNQKKNATNLGRYGSLKDLSHKAQEVTARLTAPRKSRSQEPDVASAPLSKQLCASVSTQASLNVDNLIVLHKRLTMQAESRTSNRQELQEMAEDIEKTAIEIQQRLLTLTSKLKNNNSVIRNQLASTNSNVNPANFLGNNLGFPSANVNPNLMSNIDMSRFSEMFVSMVHQITENQQNNQKK